MIQYIVEMINKPEYLWSMSDKIIFDIYIAVVCVIGFAVAVGGYWLVSKVVEWWRKHVNSQYKGKDDD